MSARSHLSRVHELRCIVCMHMGMKQQGPVVAHHLESIRDATSDYAAIPLCDDHHTGANGVHRLSRRLFETRYKLTPVDLLALAIKEMDRCGLFIH